MTNDYFIRITRSFSDVSGLVATWASRASQVAVYEHIGDKTEKTHIHLVVLGSEICSKQMKNLVGHYHLSGNKDWTFKDYDGDDMGMVYMSKGKLDPKFLKGWTVQDADLWKSQWVEPRERIDYNEELYDDVFGNIQTNEYEFKDYERRKPVYDTRLPTPIYDEKATMFEFILYRARMAAFQKNKMLWSNKAMIDYKMLVYTYIFRHDIKIPDSHKEWKKWI